MSKTRFNVVYCEKYGDVNDPKTSYKNCGSLFVNDETGHMSIKLDLVPAGKNWDGWLAVFEPREREENKPASTAEDLVPDPKADGDDEKPIDLSEIPF